MESLEKDKPPIDKEKPKENSNSQDWPSNGGGGKNSDDEFEIPDDIKGMLNITYFHAE